MRADRFALDGKPCDASSCRFNILLGHLSPILVTVAHPQKHTIFLQSHASPTGLRQNYRNHRDPVFSQVTYRNNNALRQHCGSTNGEGYFALDLNTRTLHEIVPSGGAIYMVSGLRGYFCVNAERYLPLGDGKRTVNCSFLDLWSGQLQRIRFCEAESPSSTAAVGIKSPPMG